MVSTSEGCWEEWVVHLEQFPDTYQLSYSAYCCYFKSDKAEEEEEKEEREELEEGSCPADSTSFSPSIHWTGVGTGSYPSSLLSDSVALSQSHNLSVPAFSPKINIVIVIMIIIIDFTLRCIFFYI